MTFKVMINPRTYGILRKFFNKRKIKFLARFFGTIESFRYAVSKKGKTAGYKHIDDFYIYLTAEKITIWCSAYHKGIEINKVAIHNFFRHTIRSLNFNMADWAEYARWCFVFS